MDRLLYFLTALMLLQGRGIAAIEILTAALSRGVRAGFRHITERAADLIEARFIEPTTFDTLINGPAVCPQFAIANIVMAAFMMEHE